MVNPIYWCPECRIPIINSVKCTICGKMCEPLSKNGVCNPIFHQERKLLAKIYRYNMLRGVEAAENLDIENGDVWYLGNSYYLVNGERTRIPYADYYRNKEHLKDAVELRENIDNNDDITGIERFIDANKRHIKEQIYEAEEYVVACVNEYIEERAIDGKHFVPTVSFSGGKDSTAVSRIVKDALQSEEIIHYFGDTTLEFPCTYEYVNEAYRKENPFTPMIPSETENDFFKLCNYFGPPSQFERWCCTIFKTSNLNNEYQNLNGNSLTFLGIRHSESKERQKYERTQDHSKIGSQVNCMPIISWSDCDVWLYILHKKLAFNDAYRWGYKRVGCWCCPNNSEWSLMLTDIYFPDLSKKWKNVLYQFAEKTNKADVVEYVEKGKWRVRRGASGLPTKNTTLKDTACNLSDRARNIIIEKRINRDVIEFFKPFGRLEIFDQVDASYISVTELEIRNTSGDLLFPERKVCDLVIKWGTPVLKVLPTKGTDIILLVNRLKCQLRKYQYCIRCTSCDSACPRGAISTSGNQRYYVEDTKCPQNLRECSKCIAKFYNGCITCQVLAGKKNAPVDNIDS